MDDNYLLNYDINNCIRSGTITGFYSLISNKKISFQAIKEPEVIAKEVLLDKNGDINFQVGFDVYSNGEFIDSFVIFTKNVE